MVKKRGEEGTADYGGVRRNISLSLVDAKEGNWALVYTGYAIKVLREDDLKRKISIVVNDGDEES